MEHIETNKIKSIILRSKNLLCFFCRWWTNLYPSSCFFYMWKTRI